MDMRVVFAVFVLGLVSSLVDSQSSKYGSSVLFKLKSGAPACCCVAVGADVVFVVDGSGSVSQNNFYNVFLRLASFVVGSTQLSPYTYQAGALKFVSLLNRIINLLCL